MFSWSQMKTSLWFSLELSKRRARISSWKFIVFVVVTYRRQLYASAKCAVSWPALSILFWLISNSANQKGFAINNLENAKFVLIAMTKWETVAFKKWFPDLISLVSRKNKKFLLESPNNWIPEEHTQTCPFLFCDNHPWEQYDECRVRNQHFQD